MAMEMTAWWWLTASILTAILSICCWWHFLGFGNIRGPFLWPIIGDLPQLLCNFSRLHDWMTELLEKYGGTYCTYDWIVPGMGKCPVVVTSDPRNLEYVLKTRFENFPKGPGWQAAFRDLLGGGIFNSDGVHWLSQRKTAALEFTAKSLRGFMLAHVWEQIHDRLLPVLDRAGATQASVDLQDVLLRFTFDNVCQISFGKNPGSLALGLPVNEFAAAFEQATEATLQRLILPDVLWRLKRFLGLGKEKHLQQSLKLINAFAKEIIESRREAFARAKIYAAAGDGGREEKLPHKDLLSRFMSKTDEHGLPLYSDAFLRDTAINFILAGRDTSSVALTWFFWLLSKYPSVERSILEELSRIITSRSSPSTDQTSTDRSTAPIADEAAKTPTATDQSTPTDEATKDHSTAIQEATTDQSTATGGATTDQRAPTDAVITDQSSVIDEAARNDRRFCFSYEELEQMVYLKAALSETMRLYPSVPLEKRYVVHEDTLPDGTPLSKGCHLTYSIYAMGRLPFIWGKDCLEFKPERWLQDGKYKAPENLFQYIAFNGGPRVCLGKEMALLQMKCLAATLLMHYRIRVVPHHPIEQKMSLTLFMKYGLLVQIHPRDSMDINAATPS